MEENGLRPEDIEMVRAHPNPIVQFRLWQENALRTPEDYCFNARYLIACAAHRINPARWQDIKVREDQRIRKFMDRVEVNIIVDEKEFILAKLEDSKSYQMKTEVTAKGKVFRITSSFAKGSGDSLEFRNTDEELIEKFTSNVSRIMTPNKANEIAESILELDRLGDIRKFTETLAY